MEVEATLAKLEEDTVFLETSSNELLGGIQVEPISPELVEIFQLREELRGVVVVEVDPSSQYAELLPVGTVVEQINRVAVSDAETGRQSLRQGRNLLLVNQQGIYKYLAINVK
jgi:hypothetical protein